MYEKCVKGFDKKFKYNIKKYFEKIFNEKYFTKYFIIIYYYLLYFCYFIHNENVIFFYFFFDIYYGNNQDLSKSFVEIFDKEQRKGASHGLTYRVFRKPFADSQK